MIKISRIYTKKTPKNSKNSLIFFFPKKRQRKWKSLELASYNNLLGYLKDFQRTEINVWWWYRSHQTFIRIIFFIFTIIVASVVVVVVVAAIVVFLAAAVVLCVRASLACACCSSSSLHSLCYLFSVISFSLDNQRFVTALCCLIFFFLPESLSRILDGIVLLCVLTVCREKDIWVSVCERQKLCVCVCVWPCIFMVALFCFDIRFLVWGMWRCCSDFKVFLKKLFLFLKRDFRSLPSEWQTWLATHP
jgi:hypothetical protein